MFSVFFYTFRHVHMILKVHSAILSIVHKISFFFKLFGEKRCVYSVKVFPLSIKSRKPIQKYLHIIELYANFFQNMFYSETIKISKIIILHIQSNPMSSNIRVLIKIYYISPILYFWQIISRINTIKSWFILLFLYFKIH